MTSAVLFTDPYSGHEVICCEVDGRLFGAAYDPRRAGTIVPWDADCPHCQRGRYGALRDLPVGVRRCLQMLASRRTRHLPSSVIYEYHVPTLDDNHTLRFSRRPDGSAQVVLVDNGTKVFTAHKTRGPEPSFELKFEEARPKAKVASRLARFLLSERPAAASEVAAVARPLADETSTRKHKRGRRTLCDSIDWTKVIRP